MERCRGGRGQPVVAVPLIHRVQPDASGGRGRGGGNSVYSARGLASRRGGRGKGLARGDFYNLEEDEEEDENEVRDLGSSRVNSDDDSSDDGHEDEPPYENDVYASDNGHEDEPPYENDEYLSDGGDSSDDERKSSIEDETVKMARNNLKRDHKFIMQTMLGVRIVGVGWMISSVLPRSSSSSSPIVFLVLFVLMFLFVHLLIFVFYFVSCAHHGCRIDAQQLAVDGFSGLLLRSRSLSLAKPPDPDAIAQRRAAARPHGTAHAQPSRPPASSHHATTPPLRPVPPSLPLPNISPAGRAHFTAREPQEASGFYCRLERPRRQCARAPNLAGATAPPVDRRARAPRLQRLEGRISASVLWSQSKGDVEDKIDAMCSWKEEVEREDADVRKSQSGMTMKHGYANGIEDPDDARRGSSTCRNESRRKFVSGSGSGQAYSDNEDDYNNFIRELELTSVVEDYPKLRELIQRKDEIVANSASAPMYYKCDLKEHVLSPDFFGTKFDVILVDPPWEEYVHRAPVSIAEFLFLWELVRFLWSCHVIIGYLIQQAIADTPSFIFLWVGDGVGLEQGRQCLKKWGFRRCEDVCWVKTNKKNATPGLRHDSNTLFQRSKEHCLMGIKGTVRRSTDGQIIHANIDTDMIIAEEPTDGI
nr:unnamed protein product [Digitaria exilis]